MLFVLKSQDNSAYVANLIRNALLQATGVATEEPDLQLAATFTLSELVGFAERRMALHKYSVRDEYDIVEVRRVTTVKLEEVW